MGHTIPYIQKWLKEEKVILRAVHNYEVPAIHVFVDREDDSNVADESHDLVFEPSEDLTVNKSLLVAAALINVARRATVNKIMQIIEDPIQH